MTAALARIVLATTEHTPGRQPRELASRFSFILAGSLATAAGALALAAGCLGGAFVLAAGALISLAIGLITAWILLVEVRRGARRAAPGLSTGHGTSTRADETRMLVQASSVFAWPRPIR